MVARRAFLGLLLLCLGSSLVGCTAPSGLDSIQASPASQALTVGQTTQMSVVGTYGNGKHPYTQTITTGLTWTSSNPAVASVTSTGLVVAQVAGTSTVTATTQGFSGPVSSNSTFTVTGSGTGPNTLTSITILPDSQVVANIGETSQYIAVGSYTGNPATQDLTKLVTWGSSDVFVAKIDSSGLATTISSGTTTITALYTPSPGSPTVSGTATLTSESLQGTVTLPTLTVYKVGANGSVASVTASYTLPGSSTIITAINCSAGASASLCTANVPVNVTVTLTTTNRSTSTAPFFGGWSSNCMPVPNDAYSCTIMMPAPNPQTGTIGNVTVGAIFD